MISLFQMHILHSLNHYKRIHFLADNKMLSYRRLERPRRRRSYSFRQK